MSVFHISSLTTFLLGAYMLWPFADSQYFENPKYFYKPMEFDLVLRGQYNVSQCIKDLLECWEHMRADIICDANNEEHETYCSINKAYCHPLIGNHNSFKHRYIALSGHCMAQKPEEKPVEPE